MKDEKGVQIFAAKVESLGGREVSLKLEINCAKEALLNVLGQIVATVLMQMESDEPHGSQFELGASVSLDSVLVTEATTRCLKGHNKVTDQEEFQRGMLAGVAAYAQEKKLLAMEDKNVTWQ